MTLLNDAISNSIAAGWVFIILVVLFLIVAFLVTAYIMDAIFYRVERKQKKGEIPYSDLMKYVNQERTKSGTIKHNGTDSLRERL